jgi:hypothetical protein
MGAGVPAPQGADKSGPPGCRFVFLRLSDRTAPEYDLFVTLTDENAFGVLAGYYTLEDDEYSSESSEFVTRFTEFRAAVLGFVAEFPLGRPANVLDLGHAMFVEVAAGDELDDPMAWGKALRAALRGRGIESSVLVTHGGRWVEEDRVPLPEVDELSPGVVCVQASRPSEPLRRALLGWAAAARADEDDTAGWGPGLYVDTEVVEALGRSPKNAPTPLVMAGATFYRLGG